MNATKATGKAAKYFMLRQRKGKLLPGIYERVIGSETGGRMGRYMIARAIIKHGKIKGGLAELKQRYKAMYPRGIRPAVIFPTKKPTYKARFDFHGIARRTIDQNYQRVFSEVVGEIIRTAR